jgi:predicted nuclease with TOPRIM domain
MTAPTKDKLVTISASVIGSILLMFLGLYTTGMINNRQDMQRKIDNKVDKQEYEKHCIENANSFKEIQENSTSQYNKLDDKLNTIIEQNSKKNEQQAVIINDIAWIKAKLNK